MSLILLLICQMHSSRSLRNHYPVFLLYSLSLLSDIPQDLRDIIDNPTSTGRWSSITLSLSQELEGLLLFYTFYYCNFTLQTLFGFLTYLNILDNSVEIEHFNVYCFVHNYLSVCNVTRNFMISYIVYWQCESVFAYYCSKTCY